MQGEGNFYAEHQQNISKLYLDNLIIHAFTVGQTSEGPRKMSLTLAS